MKEIKYVVSDPQGIHARPAGVLVKTAAGFKSKITITKGEKSGLSLNQPYRIFFNSLLEALSEVDFSRADIRTLTEKNPRKAFEVGVRRAGKQRKKYFLF